MMPSTRAEVRAIIKFSSDIWKTPIETFKMIHTTVYHEGLTRALGFKRHKRFRRKIFASWWQGQGLETKNWKLRHNVNLGRAWYWSAFNSFGLSNHGFVSIWTVFMILIEYLHMSNVYAARMLKDSEKEIRNRF